MPRTKKEVVKVEIDDLYQFMIAECRYGYRRNNHLMPWGAYEHVKEYLPLMLKVNPDTAIHTALQLCEECISDQLFTNFYDGLDDEFGNRKDALEFVTYLLKFAQDNKVGTSYEYLDMPKPYNYDLYEKNLKNESELRYRVYELDSFEEHANTVRELTTEPVSKQEADEILFTKELGVTSGSFNHIDIKTNSYPVRVIGEKIRIIEPESHKGKIYLIKLVTR